MSAVFLCGTHLVKKKTYIKHQLKTIQKNRRKNSDIWFLRRFFVYSFIGIQYYMRFCGGKFT